MHIPSESAALLSQVVPFLALPTVAAFARAWVLERYHELRLIVGGMFAIALIWDFAVVVSLIAIAGRGGSTWTPESIPFGMDPTLELWIVGQLLWPSIMFFSAAALLARVETRSRGQVLDEPKWLLASVAHAISRSAGRERSSTSIGSDT